MCRRIYEYFFIQQRVLLDVLCYLYPMTVAAAAILRDINYFTAVAGSTRSVSYPDCWTRNIVNLPLCVERVNSPHVFLPCFRATTRWFVQTGEDQGRPPLTLAGSPPKKVANNGGTPPTLAHEPPDEPG
jgi:hypothetical protein